jgi:hypothetical protein
MPSKKTAFNAGGNPFALSSTGDELILSASSGGVETGYRDQVSFGAAADNVSFGTVATSSAPEFWALSARAPNAANAATQIAPVILNEIHYHPVDFAGGTDNARDEFIELHSISPAAVNLSGWRLKSAVDFTFAPGTSLRPGDYVLAVGFNPATDAASLAAFKTALNVPPGTILNGPFTSSLRISEASVELAFPGTPVAGETPFILQDKLKYLDVSAWAATPDGSGPSLQRISRSTLGNDPGNWQGLFPTPGAVNANQSPILDNDGDGMPNPWELTYGLDPFSAADGPLDPDGDGQSNASEYVAQTDPRNPTDVLEVTCTLGNPNNVISFTAKANVTYSLHASTDLKPGSWTKLAGIPAGAARRITVNDPSTPQRRFYILTTPQVP